MFLQVSIFILLYFFILYDKFHIESPVLCNPFIPHVLSSLHLRHLSNIYQSSLMIDSVIPRNGLHCYWILLQHRLTQHPLHCVERSLFVLYLIVHEFVLAFSNVLVPLSCVCITASKTHTCLNFPRNVHVLFVSTSSVRLFPLSLFL